MTIQQLLDATLDYSRGEDYRGWDLYDGESSAFLRALPIDNKWLNLAFQQFVRRAPINVRPLLLVEQRRNYKGVALFTLANVRAYELTGDERRLADARKLGDWLIENRSVGYSGFCGGHKHPLQGLDHRTLPNQPGVVGTSYAVKALLRLAEHVDGDVAVDFDVTGTGVDARGYAPVARTATEFVLDDLDYAEETTEAGVIGRIKYKPHDTGEHYTLNANALGARLLLDVHAHTGDESPRRHAERILDYVASRQTDLGGWMYTDPPSRSHLSMDNFHNGFIVESLLRYHQVTGSTRYADELDEAMTLYRERLFDDDGAPNFDESTTYPRDVHAAAQGVVVFSMTGDLQFAERILRWTVDNLYAGNGRFYHEKRRFYTKRTTLMRWCQAWMAHALAAHLAARTGAT